MIDSPSRNNREAWRQRYRNCFGFLLNKDKRTLCYIEEVSDNVRFRTLSGGGFFANFDAGVQFEFLPITRGWFFTTDHGWVMLRRIPAKQFHRGISSSNTSAHYFSGNRLVAMEISLGVLRDVFIDKPTPTSGTALGTQFLLRNGVVYFFEQPVGTYKDNTVILSSGLVKQELTDFIRRAGLNYKVEVNE